MTESYKKLASLAPESDDEKVLYAAPAATSSLISNITVTNRSSSSATFDVNVYPSGATTDAELYSLETGKKFYVASAGGAGGLYSSTDGITYADTGVNSGIVGTSKDIKSVFGAGVHMFSGTTGR